MVKINQSRKICIMADSGWGKTTLLKSIITELGAVYTVFIYNTDYEPMPVNKNIVPLKPDYDKVGDINYLSLVIDRLRAKFNNFVICITDLDKFFDNTTSQNIGASGLKDLYGTGRHQRILPIVESKQPRYIPSKILANSNLFYIGKFTEVEDVKRLKNYVTGKELSELEPHVFWEIDKFTGEKKKIMVKNGEIVYV
ncbi:MAG: ATP-binding protein [Thermoplasmata archaeon]